ncbi:MAG TPA: nitrogenase-stabilizing/protective protein NifW [Stenomitos sp.]
MNRTLSEFAKLVDAEQYFEFFQLSYDPKIVSVNRLHILQKFAQAVAAIDAQATDASEAERLGQYQAALQQAYDVFLSSNAVEQKLFKVFRQKPQNVVLLRDVSTST